jgi:gliding motility-associated-like protein
LCFPVSLLQAQISGNYTIDNRQPTAGRNFNSFNDCATFLTGGLTGAVTVTVAAGSGPYNERLLLIEDIKSSVTKPLIFNCNGVTLTYLSTDAFNRELVLLNKVNYVTIDNLKIVPTALTTSEFGVGVHIVNDANHNTIRNCTILNGVNTNVPQNNEGIVINGSIDFASAQGNSHCDSNLIVNNTIVGGNTGITLSSVPDVNDPIVYMKGNQILDNKISGYWNSGIYLFYNDNLLVQGNDVSAPVDIRGSGITLFEPNINTQITANKIHHFYDVTADPNGSFKGIEVGQAFASTATANLIANNLIYDFQSAGEQLGIYADGGAYLNIYHNTISFDNHALTGSKETAGIYTNAYSGLNVLDNIISISRTTTDKNYGFHMAATIAQLNCERNLYFIPSGGATNAVGYSGGTQATLANWQTKTGKDLLSTVADPQFTDPITFNLIPNNKSIDNMGQFVGINNDITGAVRNNQHPDVGAYEFLTPTCTGPAVGGAATMLPGSPICEGSPMALNLTGNSFGVGQTYQWQSSATINGTYTNVGAVLVHPATNSINSVSTLYYRAAVTCNTQVDYSIPVLVTVTPSLAAATYTINSAVATGGTNYQTFNDALNAIRCGIRGPVVFNVIDNGTVYREQLNIPKINGTSAANTVTFKGTGATMAFNSTNSSERAVVKFNGAQWFIFDGLKVNPEATTTGYGTAFQFLNGATHNTVKNCTINMSIAAGNTPDLAGISMSPVATSYTSTTSPSLNDSNTITNNTIIGGRYGITCTSSALYVQGNIITNNIIKDFSNYGIWVSNTQNMLIEGNDISRPTRTANISSFNGIYADGNNINLLISKNRIHDAFGAAKTNTNTANGIFTNSSFGDLSQSITVSNNLIYNFNSNGPQNGINNSSSYNVNYYHNTIVLDDAAASTQNTRGISAGSQTIGLVIKDNNIYIKRGGTGPKYCLYLGGSGSTFSSDYNNFYNASTGGTRNFIGYLFSTARDYAALDATWRADWNADANSISIDPVFAPVPNGDYTPTIQAFDNKGIPVGITTDIKGQTRHAKPDIGAFEFSFCLALTKPVTTVSNTTTSQVSFAWTPIANATGYLVSTDGVNFTAPSSGATGITHTVSNIIAGTDVSLTVIALGTTVDCPNDTAVKVTGRTLCLQLGAKPVVSIDTATTTSVRFSWTAVANATGYKVSVNGGNYVTPSSGATGLYHVVTGLTGGSDVSLTVQAQGSSVNCPTLTSDKKDAQTPNNKYFVPNAFTPNNNGQSDVFKIESHEISTMRLLIFNQWGQKIFESSSQQNGWDGTFNGKQQPVGVYVYALTMTLLDGTVVNKKGTINLIR